MVSGRVAPFLRWAGGKRWLVPLLAELIPEDSMTYHEPFLGSGAVFFAMAPSPAHLSDSNCELVQTFRVVRDSAPELIQALGKYRYDRREYHRVRSMKPRTSLSKAARFVYLNRTCWNGLYRVNQSGEFNVPFGRRPPEEVCDQKSITAASRLLQGARLETLDFQRSLQQVRKGDFVFADPPYTVAHGHNGFLLYNETIFSWADQERLYRALCGVHKVGARFLLTNANHSSVRTLFRRFHIKRLTRSSIIAADPENRRHVTELVITNYPVE